MIVYVAIWCDEILGVYSSEGCALDRIAQAANGKPITRSVARIEEHVVDADVLKPETEAERFDREGWPT